MRGLRAKGLMKMAREERSQEKDILERDLVEKKSGSVVNHPYTIRAMYLKLKLAYKRMCAFAGKPILARRRVRHPLKVRVPLRPGADRQVVIKPLMLILQHCQPTVQKHPLTGAIVAVTPHPTYTKAKRAAARGDGATVKRMAAAYA